MPSVAPLKESLMECGEERRLLPRVTHGIAHRLAPGVKTVYGVLAQGPHHARPLKSVLSHNLYKQH